MSVAGGSRHHACAALLAGAVALVSPVAGAEEYPSIAASFEVASGLEGGGKGYAAGVRRARTTLRFGGELGLAETPGPFVAGALLMEVEPHASFGADVRYVHVLDDRIALHIGGLGIFAPATLFGATAGAHYRLRVHRRVSLLFGPTLQAFFGGDDLAGNTVIWQGLFSAGIHLHLR